MSIAVADNFQYKGGKPLDARMKFASVNDMTGTPAADLYDGCFAYVTGTKKYYSYDSSNTSDPTLGKWREFSAGAEYSDFTGATSQDAGAHGLVPAPTTADVDKYLKGDGSWGAIEMPNFDYSNEFGAENIYDTQEKMIGQWTDGKPLYQKVIVAQSSPGGVVVEHGISDVDFIRITQLTLSMSGYGNFYMMDQMSNGVYKADETYITMNSQNSQWGNGTTLRAVVQYTKTTDSAISIGTPNDYSTTEKIVGTWIDGSPIYQKTWTGLSISISTSSWTNVVEISNLNSVVDCIAYFNNGKSIMQYRAVDVDGNYVQLIAIDARTLNAITLRYTKTS